MKQKIVLIIFIISMYLVGMYSIANGAEAEINWYRQPDYPKVFEQLLTQDETKHFILVLDSMLDHPEVSYCKYRVRTFKRKSSSYQFEDVVLLYYFVAPTTNNSNKYVLVEAKWVYDDGIRQFWNPVANGRWRDLVLPGYFLRAKMTRNQFLEVYNKPYRLYSQNVPFNTLW